MPNASPEAGTSPLVRQCSRCRSAQVDNMEAGGFFGWFGRERSAPHATVIPPAAAAPSPDAAAPARAAWLADVSDVR